MKEHNDPIATEDRQRIGAAIDKAREDQYSVDKALALGRLLNSLSVDEERIALLFLNEHRTLQQALTRLSVAWLRQCGDPAYTYDLRNAASAAAGQKLAPHLEDIYLPMI